MSTMYCPVKNVVSMIDDMVYPERPLNIRAISAENAYTHFPSFSSFKTFTPVAFTPVKRTVPFSAYVDSYKPLSSMEPFMAAVSVPENTLTLRPIRIPPDDLNDIGSFSLS